MFGRLDTTFTTVSLRVVQTCEFASVPRLVLQAERNKCGTFEKAFVECYRLAFLETGTDKYWLNPLELDNDNDDDKYPFNFELQLIKMVFHGIS